MWRSFLARSPLVLSRLRPIRQYPCARSYSNGAAEKGRGGPDNQPHLYVALEDSNGHALYKLNVDDLDGDDCDMGSAVATAGVEELQRLPKPILRLSYRSFGAARFNALGSKIVVTTGSLYNERESSKCLTLVYDTKTTKQDIQPFVPDGLTGIYDTVAAGNKLYAFNCHSLPLYYLRDARAHPEPDDDEDDTDEPESSAADNDDSSDEEDVNLLREQAEERWTWKTSPASIPCGAVAAAASVQDCTFYVSYCPAAHPDGRTIFLSTFDNHRPTKEIHGTFSLDTDQPGGEWTRLGDWKLPFSGRAHYDRELDGWVGVWYCTDTDSQHLCCCDLPSTTRGKYPTPPPAWRICKEELTFMQAPLSVRYSSFVHTGPGRFCLVEIAPFTRFNDRRCLDVDQDILQVTMFRARYGKNDQLLATPIRPGRLYLIPGYDLNPRAFWM